MEQKRPLGVTVLGILNTCLFGAGSFLFIVYLRQNPELYREFLTESFQRSGVEFAGEFVRAIPLWYAIFPLIYFALGMGVLRGKEWARKGTVYFAFGMVAILAVAVFLQRAFLPQAIAQLWYPGILILYFTHPQVERYFHKPAEKGVES
ncbi:MAG: hypothetical protein GF333_01420 [Candidatus Omnitrophica bacterium]|nr:hypothetical protein [Candidatus Omnitrophota bacterium]